MDGGGEDCHQHVTAISSSRRMWRDRDPRAARRRGEYCERKRVCPPSPSGRQIDWSRPPDTRAAVPGRVVWSTRPPRRDCRALRWRPEDEATGRGRPGLGVGRPSEMSRGCQWVWPQQHHGIQGFKGSKGVVLGGGVSSSPSDPAAKRGEVSASAGSVGLVCM